MAGKASGGHLYTEKKLHLLSSDNDMHYHILDAFIAMHSIETQMNPALLTHKLYAGKINIVIERMVKAYAG